MSCDGYPVDCCALYRYQGEVRRAVLRFKYNGRREAARGFGRLLAEAAAGVAAGADLVTFVPMDPKRRRLRGYNQAQLLAKNVAEQLSLPCRALLVKTRSTPQQHTLTRSVRRKNLHGAYALLEESVRGKTVLLCDDIVTTGETLRECVRVLRRAHVKRVVCLLISYTGS